MIKQSPDSVGTVGKSSGNQSEATNVPAKRKFGGPQPGSGRPRGRKNNATIDREAKLLALIKDEVSERVLGTLTPLDVMALAMRKLIEAGRFIDAAEIAARMAPYRHGRMGIIAPNSQDDHARIVDEIMNDPAPDLLDKGES